VAHHSKLKGKIEKFIIIPICTTLDKDNRPIKEDKMHGIIAFTGNLPDLGKLAKQLEEKVNATYFSKLNSKLNADKTPNNR
jgi:hypothetical protein